MGLFVKGDIVVIPFPFSDFSQVKRRPALVLTAVTGQDLILCQITSKNHNDQFSVPVHPTDMSSGALKELSYIRPDKLFTADVSMIQYILGHVQDEVILAVVEMIISIIR